MGAGDATAQLIVEKKPIDVVRTIKYAGLGVFYVVCSNAKRLSGCKDTYELFKF